VNLQYNSFDYQIACIIATDTTPFCSTAYPIKK